MYDKSLIPPQSIIGIFRGFSEGGMEFHADLILPYRPDYQFQPMHGQFLLVQLIDQNEAVLGRITSLESEGRLVDPEGEDYLLRQVVEQRPVPEDMRYQYLKFRVNIRVLGVLRKQGENDLIFVPSHRRLPNVGSPVALPTPEVLRAIAGHSDDPSTGAAIGFLAMGEFVWAQDDTQIHPDLQIERWMQLQSPSVLVRFPVQNLVARRTFVFAQSGFGKSNLVKLLFSELYRETPRIQKRGGRMEPVGTLIFDRDGEYFWPDDKGRPGLCDVPHLKNHLVVFTDRKAPSAYYGSFVAGTVKLDIRRLPASMVISNAVSAERQEQQNVRKLKGLRQDNWTRLVDLVYQDGMNAHLKRVKELLGMHTEDSATSDVEANAARSNLHVIIRMIHDPHSRLLDQLVKALREGKLCVVDLSRFSGETARILAGIILNYLFELNQEEFTKADANTIPTIAVLEEAQSVLGEGSSTAFQPYVQWVKEGRKYDLGSVMITQQPGSIVHELLSQGDVWFVFHLLSAGDLRAVQKANAHYSEDLLSSLLNEPIPGHCVFWSSAGGKPYPLPIRVLSFEKRYQCADPTYSGQEQDTFARTLRAIAVADSSPSSDDAQTPENGEDYYQRLRREAIQGLLQSSEFRDELRKHNGRIRWGWVIYYIKKQITDPNISNIDDVAYDLVRPALEELFGKEQEGAWRTERANGTTTIVISPEALNRFMENA